MTVTLKPELEEELASRARAESLSIEEFVNRELARLVCKLTTKFKIDARRARATLERILSEPLRGRSATF